MMPSSSEGNVATNEFYYLVLVLAAFGIFAASMIVATIEYKAWLRRTRVHLQAASRPSTDLAPAKRPARAA